MARLLACIDKIKVITLQRTFVHTDKLVLLAISSFSGGLAVIAVVVVVSGNLAGT